MRLNFSTIRCEPSLILPQRATEQSAGYDIFAPDNVWIEPGAQQLVKLNIVWSPTFIPPVWTFENSVSVVQTFGVNNCGGFFAKVFDKSGLAVKKRFNTRAGVIDSDYPDEWGLVCVNEGDSVFELPAGKAICQFVLLPYLVAEDCLNPETVKRVGGFGSTGK